MTQLGPERRHRAKARHRDRARRNSDRLIIKGRPCDWGRKEGPTSGLTAAPAGIRPPDARTAVDPARDVGEPTDARIVCNQVAGCLAFWISVTGLLRYSPKLRVPSWGAVSDNRCEGKQIGQEAACSLVPHSRPVAYGA